jgi:hypothetical protein
MLSFAVPAPLSGTANAARSLASILPTDFSATSPVIVTGSDFQCPYCNRAASENDTQDSNCRFDAVGF